MFIGLKGANACNKEILFGSSPEALIQINDSWTLVPFLPNWEKIH